MNYKVEGWQERILHTKWPDHKRSCVPLYSLIFYHQTAIENILAEECDNIGVLKSCVWQQ